MGKRGGARPGAGRKPGKLGPKRGMTIWVSEAVADWLEQQAAGGPVGQVVEKIVGRRLK